MLTLDMFIHLEPVDRNAWQGSPDDRPLNELGIRQAEQLAANLAGEPISALYSSVAARCQQSVQALSASTGLPIEVLPEFQDSADNAYAQLNRIRADHPDGRAVICSYGDVVPALLAYLAERYAVQPLPRDNRRGVVFRVTYDGASCGLAFREPAPDFPR